MRRDDWHARLWAEIERRRALPFQWGASEGAQDCCTFAAAIVDALTDSQHVAALLTHYHDEPSALDYIDDAGGIDAAISTFLGEPASLNFAQRGDVIGLVGDIQVGVCIGHKVIAAGADGLIELPMWHVARIRWAV